MNHLDFLPIYQFGGEVDMLFPIFKLPGQLFYGIENCLFAVTGILLTAEAKINMLCELVVQQTRTA